MSLSPYNPAHLALIEQVAQIDKEAAIFLLDLSTSKMPHLNLDYANQLLKCFIFADSSQGHYYWSRIAHKLGEF